MALTPEQRAQKNDYFRRRAVEKREHVLAVKLAYRAARREELSAKQCAYAKTDEGKKSKIAGGRNREARKRGAGGRHTASDVASLFESQRGVCAGCDVVLVQHGKGKMHVDHIMPVKLGGSNWPENLQLLCPLCNTSKGAQHPDDWARRIGKVA